MIRLRAFNRHSCVHVQTFVPSPDFRALMSRLSCAYQTIRAFMVSFSCVHQTFLRLCPDFRAFIRLFVRTYLDFCAFTRLSCVYIQTFLRSLDFRGFMIRLSCFHQTIRAFISRYSLVHQIFMLMRSSPVFHAFTRLSFVHVQNFVRSSNFSAFNGISCVQQTLVRSCPDFREFKGLFCVHVQISVLSSEYWCVHDQTFARSYNFRAFNRFSCDQVQTFFRSTDFSAFMSNLSCAPQPFKGSFQAFVRS